MTITNNSWDALIQREKEKEYLNDLDWALAREYKTKKIYPPKGQIFEALKKTPKENVKVVILGQDPYHGEGQAHGMAFSVNHGVKIPPSLRNMYKELENEYQVPFSRDGNLEDWAKDGVLLLNPILTVEEGKPLSHEKLGWQRFTDEIIDELEKQDQPIVYLLWGSRARQKKERIHNPNHLVLESPHPSPLSANRGFFGNGHFRKANEFLEAHGGTASSPPRTGTSFPAPCGIGTCGPMSPATSTPPHSGFMWQERAGCPPQNLSGASAPVRMPPNIPWSPTSAPTACMGGAITSPCK